LVSQAVLGQPEAPWYEEIPPVLSSSLVFAYFSPETLLPVTSILATVCGLVMMFGRTTLRLIARGVGRSRFHKQATHRLEGPHFQRTGRTRDITRNQVGE
jgi:hypothetical protein